MPNIIIHIIHVLFLSHLTPSLSPCTPSGISVDFPSQLLVPTFSFHTLSRFSWIIKRSLINTIKLSDFPASKELLEDLLQSAIVPALDTSFRSTRQYLLHISPVFSMFKNRFTNYEVLLIAKIVSADAWTKVVKVSLSYLFGCEFLISKKVLGIFELMSFHFSPYLLTYEETSS